MFTLEQKIDIILAWIATDDFEEIDGIRQKAREALASDNSSADRKANMDDLIYDLFKEIGVIPKLTGYNYAITAVKLVIENPSRVNHITKELYPDIASKHNSTPTRVERCIRHVVETIFARGDHAGLADVFGNIINCETGKVTNGEFIAACANEIKRRMR